MEIVFKYGLLADTIEKQANDQGFILEDGYGDFLEKVLFGINAARIRGCITDSEYDRILKRIQNKLIVPNLIQKEQTDEN